MMLVCTADGRESPPFIILNRDCALKRGVPTMSTLGPRRMGWMTGTAFSRPDKVGVVPKTTAHPEHLLANPKPTELTSGCTAKILKGLVCRAENKM